RAARPARRPRGGRHGRALRDARGAQPHGDGMSAGWKNESRHALQGTWIRLAVAVLVAGALGGASHWYYGKERRDSAAMTQRVQEARARLDGARRERDSLIESSDVFRTLVD